MLVGVVTAMFTLFVPAMQAQTAQPQEQQAAPRFRSSVDIVSVAAVVRDRKGRFVTDLSQKDFQIVEAGQPRDILDFRAEVNGPVKLAVLMDVSGSMRMAQRTSDARRAAEHIFANLADCRRSGRVLVRHDAGRGADVHDRPREAPGVVDRHRPAVRADVALRRDCVDGANGRRRVEVGTARAAAAERGRRHHRRRGYAQQDVAGGSLGGRQRYRRAGLHIRGGRLGRRPARKRGRAASGRSLESPGARQEHRR